jgi:cytidylate kinase
MNAEPKVLLAISRQLGSGGAYVGQAVARRAAIRYVDREILQQAAALLGTEDERLEQFEEQAPSVWARIAGVCSVGPPDTPYAPPPIPTRQAQELIDTESRIIREIAARESAVIVGRASTYLLREDPHLISVFLHAPREWRVDRVMQTYSIADREAARQLVERSDKQRARFLQSFHGRSWTDCCNYDICLDTALVGIDATVDFLGGLVLARLGRENQPGR